MTWACCGMARWGAVRRAPGAVHARVVPVLVHLGGGPVEGHVNRIKMLKRQMYGRASTDLLRKRVLMPA
jgi:hypothetical protein